MDINEDNLQDLIKALISKPWEYDKQQQILSLEFGDSRSLAEYDVILEENYLDPVFKIALIDYLNQDNLLEGLEGPFGDQDFFSGADEGNKTTYYLEFHLVTPEKFNQLQQAHGIEVKKA